MPDELRSLLNLDYLHNSPAKAMELAILSWMKEGRNGLIHPHGFYVFPILSKDQEEWRLHVWPKGTRTINGMPAFIHTHDVCIDSRVLRGELTNIEYDISETQTDGCPLYEVNYKGNKYLQKTSNVLCKTDVRVKVTSTAQSVIKLGQSYQIRPHVFHEALVSKEISTSTLVCMHSRSPGKVKVVGLDGYPETICFQRKHCSSLDVLESFVL